MMICYCFCLFQFSELRKNMHGFCLLSLWHDWHSVHEVKLNINWKVFQDVIFLDTMLSLNHCSEVSLEPKLKLGQKRHFQLLTESIIQLKPEVQRKNCLYLPGSVEQYCSVSPLSAPLPKTSLISANQSHVFCTMAQRLEDPTSDMLNNFSSVLQRCSS